MKLKWKFLALSLSMLIAGSSVFGFQAEEEAKESATSEEQVDDEPDNSPKGQFDVIKKELLELSRGERAKLRELQKEFRAKPKKMKEAFEAYRTELAAERNQILERGLEIGAAAEQDRATSLDALSRILTRSTDNELKEKAVDLLVKHHIDNKAMLNRLGRYIRGVPSKSIKSLLEKTIENSDDEQVKGIAALSLGQHMLDLIKVRERLSESSPLEKANPGLNAYVESMSDDLELDNLKARFNRIAEDFKEVKFPIGLRALKAKKGDVIGELAASTFEVYEKKTLALERIKVGKVAPEIEGIDVDGESFKLSDYRGKVVLLDFWGDW